MIHELDADFVVSQPFFAVSNSLLAQLLRLREQRWENPNYFQNVAPFEKQHDAFLLYPGMGLAAYLQ